MDTQQRCERGGNEISTAMEGRGREGKGGKEWGRGGGDGEEEGEGMGKWSGKGEVESSVNKQSGGEEREKWNQQWISRGGK